MILERCAAHGSASLSDIGRTIQTLEERFYELRESKVTIKPVGYPQKNIIKPYKIIIKKLSEKIQRLIKNEPI